VTALVVPLAAVLVAAVGVVGAVVGLGTARLAGRFPWGTALAVERRPVPLLPVALGTGVLCALAAWRLGPTWELPAFLVLAGAGVLLAVIDVRHRLLPNRVLLPAFGAGALLLTGAAALTGDWSALLRAGAAAVVLFAVYLALALISPRSLGMGDVKLAGLLGLYLGWLGWGVLVVGAAAGFAVQALLALVLLAGRRIGLHGELPFGPAMLLGAAVAIAAGDLLLR
jgi:leader peptidase (prepilin peptidase)/N-methyltransferase